MIRLATANDAAAIARVQVDTWRSAYRGIFSDEHLDSLSFERAEERWSENLRSGTTFVAEAAGQVVGFLSCGRNRGAEPFGGEVYALYVRPEHQRRGIGRALMRAAMQALRDAGYTSMIVWVLRDNPARAFYEKLGGTRMGTKTVGEGGRDVEEVAYGWPSLAAQ